MFQLGVAAGQAKNNKKKMGYKCSENYEELF